MAASQFTVYSSSDPGNGSDQPGPIFGVVGDLLRVLDKCLVNGYTGKAAAGWTKPFANSGNIGCYKQGAGSLLSLLVNDNAPGATALAKEAWATGWETLTAITGPVGTGTGQFPTPAQAGATGHVYWRKSLTADGTTQRPWICFADASTFYFFDFCGDNPAIGIVYRGFFFGDIFSLKGSTDLYRCMIVGSTNENTTGGGTGVSEDNQFGINVTPGNAAGMWMARTFGGTGPSISVAKAGDLGKATGQGVSGIAMVGSTQSPNGVDNSWYLAPVRVFETANAIGPIRGRMRGMYHVCHPVANFVDGQTFQGSNDFAAKAFQIVRPGPNSGFWAIETSATVETN